MRRLEGTNEVLQDRLHLSNYIRVTVLPSHYKVCNSCEDKKKEKRQSSSAWMAERLIYFSL
jgi:hypothetical protein